MALKSKLESLLLVAQKPLGTKDLADILKIKKEEVDTTLESLMEEYKEEKRGWQLIKNNSKWQMVTSPDNAALVQDFLQDETSGELTQPSLETLSIIAYRGPIFKMELDRIRGVNCSLIVRNLLLRGLIEEKLDKRKNENYYTVTMDFMRFLGINTLEELPDYEKLNSSPELNEFLNQEEVRQEE